MRKELPKTNWRSDRSLLVQMRLGFWLMVEILWTNVVILLLSCYHCNYYKNQSWTLTSALIFFFFMTVQDLKYPSSFATVTCCQGKNRFCSFLTCHPLRSRIAKNLKVLKQWINLLNKMCSSWSPFHHRVYRHWLELALIFTHIYTQNRAVL